MTPAEGERPARAPSIADLDDALSRALPREWAESWDRVGLLAGDPAREITRVLVTLDPTRSAVSRAVAAGANVLLTHHPAALSMPERLGPGRGPAGVLFAALEAGVALIAEHTNLDRAPDAVTALPTLLDLEPVEPVERSSQPMTRVCVYVPPSAVEAVLQAMASSGAGRIGAYERCAFSQSGIGEFTALGSAAPCAGSVGEHSRVDELRVEMVCSRGAASKVVAAARSAHPYEEPLIVAEEVTIARSSARMGMLCHAPTGSTVSTLVHTASRTCGVTPRVWGPASTEVRTCVTATGSASSLIGDALAVGADALVCGEVRYHDALDASEAGLAIIELGHDVSEWPLVAVLARAAMTTAGLSEKMLIVEPSGSAWWTP